MRSWIVAAVIFLAGLVSHWWVGAASAPKPEAAPLSEASEELRELNRKLTSEKHLTAEVEKTTVLQLLGRRQTATGQLQVYKGQVRLELEAPEKSLLVVNPKEAWVVTYPPEDFAGAPIEAVVTSLGAGSSSQLGIGKVLSGEGILEVFKVAGVEKDKGRRTFQLEPKKSSEEFQRGLLVTDAAVEKILELVYWDQLDNQVSYKFKKMKFSDQAPGASTFSYKPPAGANVTRL